jgi:hypothetical protein
MSKKKTFRSSIAANVSTRLTGELAAEDAIEQIRALLNGLDKKGRRKALRTVDVVKELRSKTAAAEESAEASEMEVIDAIVAFMYFKNLMGKDATLEALRAEVEDDLPKAKKNVERKLEALTQARMQALATEKASVLLKDPEALLRGIVEADDEIEDELPEDEVDEWD